MIRFTLTFCAVVLIACGSRGRGDIKVPAFDKHEPKAASATASSSASAAEKSMRDYLKTKYAALIGRMDKDLSADDEKALHEAIIGRITGMFSCGMRN